MSLKASEVVHCIEFSQFQHSAGLLAFGGRTGITVKHCTLQASEKITRLTEPQPTVHVLQDSQLQEGQSLLDSLQFTDVLSIESGYDGRHTAVAWSPLASGEEGNEVLQ